MKRKEKKKELEDCFQNFNMDVEKKTTHYFLFK